MKPGMSPPLEKCFPVGSEHDHAHSLVGIERGEGGGELVPLRHAHDVERRAIEHDVGAGRRAVDLHPEAVEIVERTLWSSRAFPAAALTVLVVLARDQLAAQHLAHGRLRDSADENVLRGAA